MGATAVELELGLRNAVIAAYCNLARYNNSVVFPVMLQPGIDPNNAYKHEDRP
jgi:hypothetical protein